MGSFDFLFGKKDTATNRHSEATIEPFVFKSNSHQRYENGNPVMGLQHCIRTVCVEKNTHGCSGYKLAPGVGYIVKIYNDDLGKPNMSDKPMKIVSIEEDKVELRGFVIEAQSPFGWQEVDYSVYGFTIYYCEGKVLKCVLHMYDRNIYLEYLTKDSKSLNSTNDAPLKRTVSIKEICDGAEFEFRFKKTIVQKCDYSNKNSIILEYEADDSEPPTTISRYTGSQNVYIVLNKIDLLRNRGIIDSNQQVQTKFTFQSNGVDFEGASAEINHFGSGLSLVQITKQKGEIIAFMIYNPSGVSDYYYLIILQEEFK